MTFDDFDQQGADFGGDDFDPVVAEHFAMLDSAATPSVESVMAAPRAAGATAAATAGFSDNPADPVEGADDGSDVVPLHPGQTGVRTRLALAAAAVAVVAAGTVGLVAANGQGQGALQTGDGGVTDSEVGDVATDADPDSSLVVEVPDEAAADNSDTPATAAAGGEADAEGDRDESVESTDGGDNQALTPTTNPTADESDETTDTTAPTETTGSTEVEATSTTAAGDTTSTTRWASTTTIVDDDVLATPVEDKEVRISGTVSEVFTDCVSRLVLSEAGQIQSVSPVSCDGGSHIVVNGMRIQTTAGYGLEEDWFGNHPSDLLPGQRVTVVAVEDSRMGGILSLDCVRCGVTVGR